MQEEKNLDEFLTEVQHEGVPEQNQEEKKTPSESSTEETKEEKSPSSQGEEKTEETKETEEESKEESKDKSEEETKETEESKDSTETEDKVPFHKHPRWKSMYEKNKDMAEVIDDLKAFKDEVQPKLKELTQAQQTQQTPSWFTDIAGDNPEAWTKYQAHETALKKQIKEEFQQEQTDLQDKQKKEADKWTNWVEDSVQGLKDEGLKFDRNELMKVVVEYRPTDNEGNLDFKKGYEIMTKLNAVQKNEKTQKVKEKKKVASQTMEDSKGETKTKDFVTTHDLKNQDWTQLVQE